MRCGGVSKGESKSHSPPFTSPLVEMAQSDRAVSVVTVEPSRTIRQPNPEEEQCYRDGAHARTRLSRLEQPPS